MRVWAMVRTDSWSIYWRPRGPLLVRYPTNNPNSSEKDSWLYDDLERWHCCNLRYDIKDLVYQFPEPIAKTLDLLYFPELGRAKTSGHQSL